MGGYDGYITISTAIDTSGIETGLNKINTSLNKSTQGMSNTINKTFSLLKGSIIGAGIVLAVRQITKELGDAVSRLDTMKNYTNVMSNLGIGSKDAEASINRLSEALKGLPTTLDQGALAVQRLASANNNVKASTEMFLALNNAILAGGASMQTQATALEQLSQAYAKGKPDMMEWRTMMTAMPAQLNQIAQVMGYGENGAAQLGEALRSGSVSMNEFMLTMVKMNKQGLNGFKSLDEQARNATGGIATSIANVKNALDRGLADIMDAIGRSNIVAFFDGIRSAIDAVIPYIVAFIKLIKTAIVYILGLFGVKFKKDTKSATDGMNSFGASVSGASKDMDTATGSAKKLNKQMKQLAAFDEMNVLQDTTQSSGGSGGGSTAGGGGAGGLGDIDLSAFDDLEGKVSKADLIFEKMMKKIKSFFSEINGLGFDNLIGHIRNIGTYLLQIFTSPSVMNAAQVWANSVITNLKKIITDAIQIGINIAEGIVGSIEKYLEQNVDRIKTFLADMFTLSADNWDLMGDLSDAFAKISEIFTSDTFKQIGADIIGAIVNPLMSAIEIIVKLATDLNKLFFKPFIDNVDKLKTAWENTLTALQPFFDTLNEAMTYLGDTWTKVYDEHLHPFFESLTAGFSDTFGKWMDVYNTYVAPFIADLSKDIEKIWKQYLKPFVDAASGLFGTLIDALKVIYEKRVKPLIDFIVQYIVPVLIPILQQIWNVVKTVFSQIINIITVVINVIKGIIEFIIGVFTGDWERAWNGIKSIFTSIWDGIKNTIKIAIDFVKDTIKNGFEMVKNTTGRIIDGIKDKVSSVFNGIKDVIRNVMNAISSTMSSIWNGIWSTIRGVINRIISGIETMCNTIIKGLNLILTPLRNVGNSILKAVGISGFSFNAIGKVSLPRLAKGGIVNLPSRGVPVGNAIAGERGQEGVIPLTDSQQMALLGEAIGKYITINANITNTMNGRVISRELQKINNESDFAFNR